MLPWQHYFWMTTKLLMMVTPRRTAKNNMFILTKTTTLHVHHAILYIYFLFRHCTTMTWNFLISRARNMEYVNTTQKLSLSFSQLK